MGFFIGKYTMPPPQPQRPLSDRGETDEIGNLTDKKVWLSGILIQFSYSNAHHDHNPICVVLYVDRRYCHAINCSYMNGAQRRQFKAGIRMWNAIDPRLKYNWLRLYNKSALVGYRTYFQFLLHPLTAWPIPEAQGALSLTDSESMLASINGIKPTDWGKFTARAVKAAKARDIVVSNRPNPRPNQQKPSNRPNARPLAERVQSAIRTLENKFQSGASRPPSTRPRSQRPGS